MVKACLLGAAVTFACIALPIVHFITGIPSAFIGGYFAGSRAAATPGAAVVIGGAMAAIVAGPAALTLGLVFGMGGSTIALVAVALGGWIALLGTFGALLGGNAVRKQAEQESA